MCVCVQLFLKKINCNSLNPSNFLFTKLLMFLTEFMLDGRASSEVKRPRAKLAIITLPGDHFTPFGMSHQ